MISTFLKKVIGSKNDRELRRMAPLVDRINVLEPEISRFSDGQLRSKTEEFKARLAHQALDDLLPEAFAVVREASRRVLSMRHFDVQLVGGIILHEGTIAEMKTGEGKTLVATLPVYLNALTGRGVHVITVNDYLAKRDSQWMGEIYRFLGLSVGLVQHDSSDGERQVAYGSDVTYGTNNEFGFDYLRDNMKFDSATFVQRELNYGIVDEVDSILIDEARTPLIISGPAEESTDLYYRVNQIVPQLKGIRALPEWDEAKKAEVDQQVDFTWEEKSKTVALTSVGNAKAERLLGVENLYDLSNMTLVHHMLQALRAHVLFKRDVDYVVKDGEVLIVDEFTGRLMPGRRWSDGLHQAVEAKEGVKIASENQTLATITFQNYFRLYKKLAGMTGTADTEAPEFAKIYNLDVLVVPPNRPMIRKDFSDLVYRTEREKFEAIVKEIEECYERGQPVLVGTISIERSERLSGMLKRRGIPHSVLNAKYHEKEAEIVAQAGRYKAVTIATNMAGRGTDILLGGNPDFLYKRWLAQNPEAPEEEQKAFLEAIGRQCEDEKTKVIALSGLHILGTERHESRRIDNQLRGRSGRQGDPGTSRFYLALEDDLLRIFGSDRIAGLMHRLGMEEGVPIEHRMVTRAIENAQKRVEAHNFDIRKQLLEYDDVMNKQREVIYTMRREILAGEDVTEEILGFMEDLVGTEVAACCPEGEEGWDLVGLAETLHRRFFIRIDPASLKELGSEAIRNEVLTRLREIYSQKEEEFGKETLSSIQKMILLRMIDTQWKDHLLGMDSLKEGIGLRGYGQRDPLSEYKKEGFEIFAMMVDRIKADTLEHLFRVQMVSPASARGPGGGERTVAGGNGRRLPSFVPEKIQMNRGPGGEIPAPVQRNARKVGRNETCPCGSGRKYKRCCGR